MTEKSNAKPDFRVVIASPWGEKIQRYPLGAAWITKNSSYQVNLTSYVNGVGGLVFLEPDGKPVDDEVLKAHLQWKATEGNHTIEFKLFSATDRGKEQTAWFENHGFIVTPNGVDLFIMKARTLPFVGGKTRLYFNPADEPQADNVGTAPADPSSDDVGGF